MKLILLILGGILILLGLILLPLPIPFGLILIVIGIVLIISNNKHARKLLRSARSRWGWLDSFFRKVGKIIPRKYSKEIEKTDPNGEEQEDEEEEDDSDDDPSEDQTRQHTTLPSHPILKRYSVPPRYRPGSRPGK